MRQAYNRRQNQSGKRLKRNCTTRLASCKCVMLIRFISLQKNSWTLHRALKEKPYFAILSVCSASSAHRTHKSSAGSPTISIFTALQPIAPSANTQRKRERLFIATRVVTRRFSAIRSLKLGENAPLQVSQNSEPVLRHENVIFY